MSELKVHADFDHDGRISKRAAERELKQELPGLIILPNIDADGKKLPAAVKKRSPITLDHRRSRSGIDRELSRIVVEVADASAAKLSFNLVGSTADRFAIFDRKYKKLSQIGTRFDFAVPSAGTHEFFIEVNSLPGTPLVPKQEDEGPTNVAVNIDLFDAGGVELAADQITVSPAPVIFIDNTRPAERLYMCEIAEQDNIDRGNLPSVVEVSEIIKKIRGVDFVLIPTDVNNRDAWIQDQFQTGYSRSASGTVRVVVHLPRLSSNIIRSEFQSNLATFVPEHFPSTDLGVFQDFYEREVGSGTDRQGKVRKITFVNSYELVLLFGRVKSVWGLIRTLYPVHLTKRSRDAALEGLLARLPIMSFYEARMWLKTGVGIMRKLLLRRQSDPALKEGQEERLSQEERNLSKQFGLVERTVVLDLGRSPGKLVVATKTFGDIVFTKAQANELGERLPVLHSSINYGGNLEVSGPVKNAPLGKLVLGAHKFADPDLLHFLKQQKVQPLVDVDTSWLHVSHVDEVMAFLPAPKSADRSFVIALASPRLAMQIIDTAWATHVEQGGTKATTAGDDIDALNAGSRDLTTDGDAPLTRLLRGRYWLHHNPVGVFEEHKPPQIYLDMLEHYPLLHNVIAYEPEPGPDRYYEAAMSVREFRHFGRFTNDWLGKNQFGEDQELSIPKVLAREFPLAARISIPVLYDEVQWTTDPDTREDKPDFDSHQTSAFLPNGVNMQVVNDHLLIPKPFGPRASPAVAARILKKILPGTLHGNLNPGYFAKKNLDKVYHWVKRPLVPGSDYSDLNRMADQFRDGFPDLEEEEVRELIHKANRTHFKTSRNPSDDGFNLTEGWHKLHIPESTVDLFEACIQVQLEALGLTVHFVDTWYYHIRLGEIHCGTNVLRQAPGSGAKWWEQVQFDAG